jgi:hypothetical protein
MAFARLPESVSTLYAELLDQAVGLERLEAASEAVPGGPVAKAVRGRRYLYWQIRKGDQVLQRYLGPDTPELRADLDRRLAAREELAPDREALARLAAMAARGGALREATAVAEVLELLAELGLFRRGGVLVGTQAYRCYGNLLGWTLPAASLRTQDIDVAQDLAIALASAEEPAPPVADRLAGAGFLPVPGLDPREPHTSFKIRGRDLRVDFLVPARSGASTSTVRVAGLGLAAQPLPFLDYLIEEPIPAVVIAPRPVLVRVPRPGRFALHKLWTAARRPASEEAKARKDRTQAAALRDLLASERPDDLEEARSALARHPTAQRLVERELHRLERN